MSQWNLIIDVARCENCNNCVLANKDEFVGNNFPGYSAPQPLHGESTIKISRTVRGEGHMVDAAYSTTQRLGGDPLDPLRMVHSLGFCNGVHLAPTVHAALNRLLKDTCIALPFWAFADECAEFGPTGYSRSQDARLARLITGIQMCLKGSPVLPLNDIESWDKLAFDHCDVIQRGFLLLGNTPAKTTLADKVTWLVLHLCGVCSHQ
jgi:hypothetical protein